jgi:predicted kinase
MQPYLIVITGHPGSGKTSIARQLSERLHLPVISKDTLKERMFDELGSSGKEWSLKVSSASHRIMDDIIEQTLLAGNSIIVESNFKENIDSERFAAVVKRYHVSCVQILCVANGPTLFQRWNERIKNKERHEGHVENANIEQIRQDLLLPYPPLALPGQTIELDTSDFSRVVLPDIDYAAKKATAVGA